MSFFAVSDENQEFLDIPAPWGAVRLTLAFGELWSVAFSLDPPQQTSAVNPTLNHWAGLTDAMLQSATSLTQHERAALFSTRRWQALSPVSRAVLERVAAIPCGQFRTYSHLAQEIGNPKAVRAVGRIMASNPFPILVPCHRVVSKHMLGAMDMTNPKSFEGTAFGGCPEFVPIGAWLRINDLTHA